MGFEYFVNNNDCLYKRFYCSFTVSGPFWYLQLFRERLSEKVVLSSLFFKEI